MHRRFVGTRKFREIHSIEIRRASNRQNDDRIFGYCIPRIFQLNFYYIADKWSSWNMRVHNSLFKMRRVRGMQLGASGNTQQRRGGRCSWRVKLAAKSPNSLRRSTTSILVRRAALVRGTSQVSYELFPDASRNVPRWSFDSVCNKVHIAFN